jgi:hypothetical protein
MKTQKKKGDKRQPPIKIPLGFDQAVGGLLKVKPTPAKKAKATKKKAKKK